MAIELPLFPLNVVLFPGADLPLHIFEARYRLMMNECYKYGFYCSRVNERKILGQ